MRYRPEGPRNRGGGPRGDFVAPRYGWSERRPYDRDIRRPRGRYGHDYWWMGERAMPRQPFDRGYDEMYRFTAETHPRFSPVGGMEPGFGSWYPGRNPRIHDREHKWFSDWTRWF